MEDSGTTLTQKSASGVAWIASLQVSRQVLSLVSVSVLARNVPESASGLLSMATVLMNFFDTFKDFGTNSALVRETHLTDRIISTVFWINCMVGLALAGIVFGLSAPAALFFHEPALAPVVQALAWYFFLSALGTVPGAMLTRQMAFRKSSLAQLVGSLTGTGFAITLALMGAGVWSLVVANLMITGVTSLVFWIFSPIRLRWVLDLKGAKSLASYGVKLSGFSIVNYFSRNADNLIVGRYLGSKPLGYYQMGYTLMTYPLSNFSTLIAGVLFPAMAQVKEETERFRTAMVRASALVSLFTFPVMLGLFVTADPFVRVVLGGKWLPVIGLLRVFAPLGMLQSVVTLVGLVYTARGRTGLLFAWGSFSGAVLVLSFFIGVRWGIQGVANCYAIAWGLLLFPGLHLALRQIDLPILEFCRGLWPTFAASIAMTLVSGACLYGLGRAGVVNAPVRLFGTAAIGATFYVTVMYWWRPPVMDEFRSLVKDSGNPAIAKLARFL